MKLYVLMVAALLSASASATEIPVIEINTDNTSLVFRVADNGRLYQVYYGERLCNPSEYASIDHEPKKSYDGCMDFRGWEVAPGSGSETHFEPTVAITHNDGNPSTWLYYKKHLQYAVTGGIQTDIWLYDDKYPVDVVLHYVAFPEENVIKTWSEIIHHEKKPVKLWRYASTILYFNSREYHLTEFYGDWAKESQMVTQQLQFGKKVLESKMGVRTAIHSGPFFELGIDAPAREDSGQVMLGTLAWSGNFQFTFEVDNIGHLRVIPSVNPYASEYELAPGEIFTTPEFIFTMSYDGVGTASRNMHDWARNHQLKDGQMGRMTLLNNWENTLFDFDEKVLVSLMKEAKELGVDMFLLDDGWFGNEYPRINDHAGLGDWEAMRSKLPGGIPALVSAAEKEGLKFGIWIEPEMVNPKSRLFEDHPDWAVLLPNRTPYYHRNQLVLDMSNPKVQDYVFDIVDRIVSENPGLAFFKWDCNAPINNIYSPYLNKKQGNLYVEHTLGVRSVLERVQQKFPHLQMMMCSSGGGRCDYDGLKYFTEYWCSDNTDPVERIFTQWGQSHFFPSKAMCSHVTEFVANRNKTVPLKFRIDVSSMCKFGFDIGLSRHTAEEIDMCKEAVKTWKRLEDVILDGDMYRLVSPYEGNHMALMYAEPEKGKAVVFTYDIYPRYHEQVYDVRLKGLAPEAEYLITELNLPPGKKSSLPENGKVYSGDYLMKVGLNAFTEDHLNSRMIELTRQ